MVPDPTRLSPVLGAELRGLDLSRPLGDRDFAALREAWLGSDGLLVVRGQHLDEAAQVAFSRRFGPIFGDPDTEPLVDTVDQYMHPDWPQIYRVSNRTGSDGRPMGRRRAGTYWHSDVSFLPRPAMASILLAIEIPPLGGDTLFASTSAAYDALSEPMKALLEPLRAVHDFAAARAGWSHESKAERDASRTRNVHPVVRTHPETGRRALFVNPGFTAGLEGFEPAESAALLAFLFDHATRPEWVYRHRWEPHDLLIWDNRCTMHYAVADYPDGHPRHMHRTTVIGDRPR
jgi:taurine dioxygenase